MERDPSEHPGWLRPNTKEIYGGDLAFPVFVGVGIFAIGSIASLLLPHVIVKILGIFGSSLPMIVFLDNYLTVRRAISYQDNLIGRRTGLEPAEASKMVEGALNASSTGYRRMVSTGTAPRFIARTPITELYSIEDGSVEVAILSMPSGTPDPHGGSMIAIGPVTKKNHKLVERYISIIDAAFWSNMA